MGNIKIGLQLYSVRDVLGQDLTGGLAKIKAMGYDYVELAGYYGRTPQEIKDIFADAGLICVSAHVGLNNFLQDSAAQIEYLKAVGLEYCAVPWLLPQDFLTAEGLQKNADGMAKMAALLKQEGITLMYHNHEFELSGGGTDTPLDKLLKMGDGVFAAEPDTCWIKYAGVDPVDFLVRYKGRVPVVHIKDYSSDSGKGLKAAVPAADGRIDRAADNFRFCPLGQGVMDIKGVADAAIKAGAKYLIVEQDSPENLPSLTAAKESIDYLRKILG